MRLLVIIVSLLVSQCLSLSHGYLRIINGITAKPKQFPYVVALHSYFTNSEDEPNLCGGTIISTRWILTAAHCLKETNVVLLKVLVVAGSIHMKLKDATGSVQMWVKHSDTIVHQHYDRDTATFDIGLIKLPRELKLSSHIQVAKLPKRTKNTYVGRTGINMGWGITSKQQPSDILQYVKLKIISNKQCEKEWNAQMQKDEHKLMLSSFLCVDSTKGLPCRGDSGGPLILDDSSRTVVGIVSHGYDFNCVLTVPDIFTRVSSFVDWIQQQTNQLS